MSTLDLFKTSKAEARGNVSQGPRSPLTAVREAHGTPTSEEAGRNSPASTPVVVGAQAGDRPQSNAAGSASPSNVSKGEPGAGARNRDEGGFGCPDPGALAPGELVGIFEVTSGFTTCVWLCKKHVAQRKKDGWSCKRTGEVAGNCTDCELERQRDPSYVTPTLAPRLFVLTGGASPEQAIDRASSHGSPVKSGVIDVAPAGGFACYGAFELENG